MKTIGLIGGMSWESSIEYYRLINEFVRDRLGRHHSAKSIMVSLDFAEIEAYQSRNEWSKAANRLVIAAQQLERAGAECILICANTMHKVAADVERHVAVPLIHIADATAERIHQTGLTKVGLLGTRYTMTHTFYKNRLIEKFGLNVLVPAEADREIVHRVIYEELCLGQINNSARTEYKRIMQQLIAQGAQGIILGCTEICLLIKPEDSPTPLFDTTRIHAEVAVAFALTS